VEATVFACESPTRLAEFDAKIGLDSAVAPGVYLAGKFSEAVLNPWPLGATRRKLD
jgi:hypothetical protein